MQELLNHNNTVFVGVCGSTGYTGNELVKLLLKHPKVELVFLGSNQYAEKKYQELFPSIKTDLKCIKTDSEFLSKLDKNIKLDLVFMATPNGFAQEHAPSLIKQGINVIDLSADYRFNNLETYSKWYGFEHKEPELNDQAPYGLVEIFRPKLQALNKPALIANPGCYTTASLLSLIPLCKYAAEKEPGLIDWQSIIIDGKSGVSGAGKKAETRLLFSEVNENLYAYNLAGKHRHGPEIEEILSKITNKKEIKLSFSPHLIPMTRGLLTTSYITLQKNIDLGSVQKIYQEAYNKEHFIKLIQDSNPVETRFACHSNKAFLKIELDENCKRLVITCAIDNLGKGAAGQAVQNMNVLFGFTESLGLN